MRSQTYRIRAKLSEQTPSYSTGYIRHYQEMLEIRECIFLFQESKIMSLSQEIQKCALLCANCKTTAISNLE